MVKRIILAATLAATFVILAETVITPADAQSRRWQMHGGVYCPVGTCGRNGNPHVPNLAKCKASNCRR